MLTLILFILIITLPLAYLYAFSKLQKIFQDKHSMDNQTIQKHLDQESKILQEQAAELKQIAEGISSAVHKDISNLRSKVMKLKETVEAMQKDIEAIKQIVKLEQSSKVDINI